MDNIHYRHVTDSISTLLKHRPENKECRQPLAFSLGVKKFSSTTPYPQRKQNKFLKDFHTVRSFFSNVSFFFLYVFSLFHLSTWFCFFLLPFFIFLAILFCFFSYLFFLFFTILNFSYSLP